MKTFLTMSGGVLLALSCVATSDARSDTSGGVTINNVPSEKAQPLATRFIRSPGPNQRLAPSSGSQSVYDASGGYVGDVKGFVVSFDGSKQAVVIGIGRGLALGEHEVAIGYSYLQRNGGIAPGRITLPMTGEQLQQSPSFE